MNLKNNRTFNTIHHMVDKFYDQRTVKCFHHNDNDGYLGAYIIYLFTENSLMKNYFEIDYSKTVVSENDVNNGDIVFIVDLSFNKNTYSILNDIAKKATKVYWFDHHKTSLDIINDNNIILENNIEYDIDMNRCGAMIAFDNLFEGVEHPTLLTLVDDYDRWQHKYPESDWLKAFTDSAGFSKITDWYTLECDLKGILKNGELLKTHEIELNTKDFDRSGYTCTINGYKCLVMNKPGNSAVFGKYFKDNPLAITWYYNGVVYTYSIYSSLPNIDCSKIAMSFNPKGGGHKGAAGWTSDKLLIRMNDVINITIEY